MEDTMSIIIKATDQVEFEKPVVLKGSFDTKTADSINYNIKITGPLSGVQLREIIENSSSLKVRIRKIKNDLKDQTFTALLALLGDDTASATVITAQQRKIEEQNAAIEAANARIKALEEAAQNKKK